MDKAPTQTDLTEDKTPVTQNTCDVKMRDVSDKLSTHGTKLAEIKGGIGVLKWLVPLIVTIVGGLLATIITIQNQSMQKQLDIVIDHLLPTSKVAGEPPKDMTP